MAVIADADGETNRRWMQELAIQARRISAT